jgi:hypothetical protein
MQALASSKSSMIHEEITVQLKSLPVKGLVVALLHMSAPTTALFSYAGSTYHMPIDALLLEQFGVRALLEHLALA